MSKCFLITGGGTGAKVAEAYVHLCAAGCGPAEVHLLLIDADTDNGNVARTTDTITVYSKVRPWGWSVQPKDGPAAEFFAPKITPYFLTSRVSDVIGGSLDDGAGADDELHEILDLLYDQDEQESDNQFGFLARPNLGSLILAEHLEHQLRTSTVGTSFVAELRRALLARETVQIMVVGSIFGGTGASLLPVARTCLINVLALEETDEARALLHFAAVMMLPYFSPNAKVATVDPQRFLLDTSLALQYYGASQMGMQESYDRIYLVGSDNPGGTNNQLRNPVPGGKRQTNPAFVEEWIAALAVRHFAETGGGQRAGADRVFVLNTDLPSLTWENLPCQALGHGQGVTEKFSHLLHLAAFFVRPQRDVSGALSGGLLSLLTKVRGGELEYFSWFERLLGGWAEQTYPAYQRLSGQRGAERWETLRTGVEKSSVDRLQADLGEYFVRLLAWSFTALKSPGFDLIDTPAAGEATRDYARLHSIMCDIDPAEIRQDGPVVGDYRLDNPLARLVRAGGAALTRDKMNSYQGKPGGDRIEIRRPVNNIARAIVPCVQPAELEAAAHLLGRKSAYNAYFTQQ